MLYFWIDILGTVAFAISGANVALSKRFDLFGIFIIAFVTATGGGTIRDLLLGVTPVSWLTNLSYFYAILVAVIISIVFRAKTQRFSKSLFVFDTLGIGLYTIVGIERAISTGLNPIFCVAIGTISACFGGVSRDILCTRVPIIFHKEIYATACIAGGIVYFLLVKFTRLPLTVIPILSIAVVILVRGYAVLYKKSLPSLYPREEQK